MESNLGMKVAIVGTGAVGSTCAMATVLRGVAHELVLVDRTRARAKGLATDLRYGTPLSPIVEIADGEYDDLGVMQPELSSEERERPGAQRRNVASGDCAPRHLVTDNL